MGLLFPDRGARDVLEADGGASATVKTTEKQAAAMVIASNRAHFNSIYQEYRAVGKD